MDESDKNRFHEMVNLMEAGFLISSVDGKVSVISSFSGKIDRIRLAQELMRVSAFLNNFGGANDATEI